MKYTINRTIKILIAVSLSGSIGLAQESLPTFEAEQKLESAFRTGVEKVADKELKNEKTKSATPAKPQFVPTQTNTDQEADKVIDGLIAKVRTLKAQQIVDKQVYAATEEITPKTATVGAKVVYPYQEGKIYTVTVGVEQVTDIMLEPGEALTSAPISGDTTRWKVSVVESGGLEKKTTHIVIRALEEGLSSNLILITDRRTYHISIRSASWYQPAISWTYPLSEEKEFNAKQKGNESVAKLTISPENLDFDYEIEAEKQLSWKPTRVFNDGNKTYIQLPPKVTEAPALFVINDDGEPELTNYRVNGQYFIVDYVVKQAELRIGRSSRIAIIHNSVEKSFWEKIL